MATMRHYTDGQKVALLILANGGAVRADATGGGPSPQERTVHSDVADWLIERGLATAKGRMIVLTEAGQAACKQTHPEWYEKFAQDSGSSSDPADSTNQRQDD